MSNNKANVITITNQKGGVGKTTTVAALVEGLAKNKKRVLCIDLDPQGSLGFSLGVNIENAITIYDVFKGECDVLKAITKLELCDILPSNILLSSAELEFNRAGREFMLKNIIEPLLEDYDYIIIDTPPALNVLTINAYVAANSLIVPMIPDILSLLGISQLKDTIDTVKKFYNPDLQLLGILLTKYNRRTKLTREVKDMAKQIAEQLNTVVIETYIRNSVSVAEAPAHGESIITYSPRSTAGEDYALLVKKLISGKL